MSVPPPPPPAPDWGEDELEEAGKWLEENASVVERWLTEGASREFRQRVHRAAAITTAAAEGRRTSVGSDLFQLWLAASPAKNEVRNGLFEIAGKLMLEP